MLESVGNVHTEKNVVIHGKTTLEKSPGFFLSFGKVYFELKDRVLDGKLFVTHSFPI